MSHVEKNPYEITRRQKVDAEVKKIVRAYPLENNVYTGIPRGKRFTIVSA
ncbi:MAG: hypothetical protein WCL18_01580 [bacterium]